MSFPNFFLVGAPRCGTTSMYSYLKQHPEIYLSVLKEPHFFSSDLTAPPQAVVDQELYLSLFEGAADEPVIGEGSVWYLESREAPLRIYEVAPEARILILLRQPVDMAFSLHGLYCRTGNEELPDFDDALAAQADRAAGRRIPSGTYFPEGLQYESVIRYGDRVARYLEIFGREQVHVLIFEEMVAHPARVYRQALEFLRVDPDFVAEFDRDRAKVLIRQRVLQQLRHTAPEIRAKMKGGGRRHTVTRSRTVRPDTRRRIEESMAEDVDRLAQLLERDLAPWWPSAVRTVSRS